MLSEVFSSMKFWFYRTDGLGAEVGLANPINQINMPDADKEQPLPSASH